MVQSEGYTRKARAQTSLFARRSRRTDDTRTRAVTLPATGNAIGRTSAARCASPISSAELPHTLADPSPWCADGGQHWAAWSGRRTVARQGRRARSLPGRIHGVSAGRDTAPALAAAVVPPNPIRSGFDPDPRSGSGWKYGCTAPTIAARWASARRRTRTGKCPSVVNTERELGQRAEQQPSHITTTPPTWPSAISPCDSISTATAPTERNPVTRAGMPRNRPPKVPSAAPMIA